MSIAGCRTENDSETHISKQAAVDEMQDEDPQKMLEEQSADPLLIQASLFIQDGLRTYEIEGTYHAYFAEPEEDSDSIEVVLVCGDDRWYDCFSYSYDVEMDWYTFTGQFEPIFSKEDADEWRGSHTSDIEEIMESYVYETEISRYSYIYASKRYGEQGGPVERDEKGVNDYWHGTKLYGDNDISYRVETSCYTYYDDRMDIDIIIEHPYVILYGDYDNNSVKVLEEKINEQLKEAFFYGYWSDSLHPYKEIYTYIGRQFFITRQDNDYLSMRIYEFNASRMANHPNEWETGITIDMHTGETLTLADVVGEEWTILELLESSAFHCLWGWENDDGEVWIRDLIEMTDEEEPLSNYDSYFYITDTALGLITFESRYYTSMEAEFTDLGIDGL